MFNPKLYTEGLRQSFLFGIFMIVLCTIINCFYPFNLLMEDNYYNYTYNYTEDNNKSIYSILENPDAIYDTIVEHNAPTDNAYNLSIEFANISMLTLMFIVPLVMIFTQFKFLNNRKACDFYHSIPVTRFSLVFNFSLSALTYTFLCMIIPMLCNGLIYYFIESTVLNYSILMLSILEKVIISFLIYASLLIGISISGQVITTGIIAGLVLFLPRFFVTMIVYGINFKTQYINGDSLFTDIIGNKYNLLVAKFTSIPDARSFYSRYEAFVSNFEDFEKLSYNLGSYVYTLVLAIVLFLIGCQLFVKRKSEMAGKNTATPLLQHLVRICCVIPAVIFIVFLYITSLRVGVNFSIFFSEVFVIVIFIVVAYFTYELITTRDLKKLIKSAITFPVLIIFGFGYYGVILLGSQMVLSHSTINANDIKSVNLDFNGSNTNQYQYISMYDEYTLDLIKDYTITNPDIIELVGSSYVHHIETNKTEPIGHSVSSRSFIQTTVKTNSKTLTKYIYYTDETIEKIFDILLEDEYINTTLLSNLPDKSSVVSTKVTSLSNGYNTSEQTQNIIDVLYQEYNNLSLDQQLQVAFSSNVNSYSEANNNNVRLYTNTNIYTELNSSSYTGSNNRGKHKESMLYTNLNAVYYNKSVTTTTNYESDEEQKIDTLSNYNSNDLPLALALYTKDNQTKFIYLNEFLPETKKLIIDMYINDNQSHYELARYFCEYNINVFEGFNISSLDDYYNLVTQVEPDYESYTNKFNIDPSKELLNLLYDSLDNLDNIDYDNLYLVSFSPYLSTTISGNSANGIQSQKLNINEIRVLLPFTQEEFETVILNFEDFARIMHQNK